MANNLQIINFQKHLRGYIVRKKTACELLTHLPKTTETISDIVSNRIKTSQIPLRTFAINAPNQPTYPGHLANAEPFTASGSGTVPFSARDYQVNGKCKPVVMKVFSPTTGNLLEISGLLKCKKNYTISDFRNSRSVKVVSYGILHEHPINTEISTELSIDLQKALSSNGNDTSGFLTKLTKELSNPRLYLLMEKVPGENLATSLQQKKTNIDAVVEELITCINARNKHATRLQPDEKEACFNQTLGKKYKTRTTNSFALLKALDTTMKCSSRLKNIETQLREKISIANQLLEDPDLMPDSKSFASHNDLTPSNIIVTENENSPHTFTYIDNSEPHPEDEHTMKASELELFKMIFGLLHCTNLMKNSDENSTSNADIEVLFTKYHTDFLSKLYNRNEIPSRTLKRSILYAAIQHISDIGFVLTGEFSTLMNQHIAHNEAAHKLHLHSAVSEKTKHQLQKLIDRCEKSLEFFDIQLEAFYKVEK